MQATQKINKHPCNEIIGCSVGNIFTVRKVDTFKANEPKLTPNDRKWVGKVSTKHSNVNGIIPIEANSTTEMRQATGIQCNISKSKP